MRKENIYIQGKRVSVKARSEVRMKKDVRLIRVF